MTVIFMSFFVEFLISCFRSGSESYSELNPTEPQDEFLSEEVPLKLSVAGLGQQIERTDAYKEQVSNMSIIFKNNLLLWLLICCYGKSNLINALQCHIQLLVGFGKISINLYAGWRACLILLKVKSKVTWTKVWCIIYTFHCINPIFCPNKYLKRIPTSYLSSGYEAWDYH